MPPQYGGRLSSVLDVKLKEGNSKRISGSGGIGLITSRLSFDGPIVKDKSTFVLAGRISYNDWVLKLINNLELRRSSAFFMTLMPSWFIVLMIRPSSVYLLISAMIISG